MADSKTKRVDPSDAEPLPDGTTIQDTEPLATTPPPAADPAEGQLDAANDEQLNTDPQPVVAAGPDRGERRDVSNKQGGILDHAEKDSVRTSQNSVWCPNDGIASPRGTQECPACGFDFKESKSKAKAK